MKNDMKIVLRGIQPRHNGESAVPGTASTVINLREREEALEVVGVPRQVGTLSPGDRVLLVDDDNTLVLRDNKVMVGDTVVLDAGCPVTGAHKVGALIVVVTQEGKQLLRRRLRPPQRGRRHPSTASCRRRAIDALDHNPRLRLPCALHRLASTPCASRCGSAHQADG